MLGRPFPFRQAQVETVIIYPEFRMAASWACDAGYRQIFNASLCVAWREGLGGCVSKQGPLIHAPKCRCVADSFDVCAISWVRITPHDACCS